jgi:uncharacterized protein YbaA (DUF1428 family)
MPYVDGFVLPVPKRNLATYRRMARAAGKVWREHGALQFMECVGDDLAAKPGMGITFPRLMKPKPGETILFSFITYRSRAHRDAVNKKVMADPRMNEMSPIMPFDVKRMAYGGFKAIVSL